MAAADRAGAGHIQADPVIPGKLRTPFEHWNGKQRYCDRDRAEKEGYAQDARSHPVKSGPLVHACHSPFRPSPAPSRQTIAPRTVAIGSNYLHSLNDPLTLS
jgi:hypothetical protein